jgi:hypothetical protein
MRRAHTITLVLIASVTLGADGLQARDCQDPAAKNDTDCRSSAVVAPHSSTWSWYRPWSWWGSSSSESSSRSSSVTRGSVSESPSAGRAAPAESSPSVARGGFGAAGEGASGG